MYHDPRQSWCFHSIIIINLWSLERGNKFNLETFNVIIIIIEANSINFTHLSSRCEQRTWLVTWRKTDINKKHVKAPIFKIHLSCNVQHLRSSSTYTDSKRVVSQDFKASTLLICIVVEVNNLEPSKQQRSAKLLHPQQANFVLNSRQTNYGC